MTALPKSGRFYPNLFVRIALSALTEVVGEHGMQAVFRMAQLSKLIEALPPADENKEFDAADFSAVFQTLEEIFSVQGAHGLAIRAGRMTFTEGLKQYGAAYDVENLPCLDISLNEKVQRGLEGIAALFNRISDQSIEIDFLPADRWRFTVYHCAVCQGRQSSQPVCAFTEGLLEEALFYFSGGSKFKVEEVTCIAQGAAACQYTIQIPLPENPPFTV